MAVLTVVNYLDMVSDYFKLHLLQSPSEDQKTLVDQACQQLTADNTELASAFIQKTAVEKAVSEMDKRMTNVSQWSDVLYSVLFIKHIIAEIVAVLVTNDMNLLQEYELRKVARSEGRRYCDPTVLTYQAERMPEQLRLKVCHYTVLISIVASLVLITPLFDT